MIFMKRIHNVLGKICFGIITLGQWLFGCYILGFYYKSAVAGDFKKWNEVLPHGYVSGDWFGNLLMGTHILIALIIMWGGPLQFFSNIRNRFPKFHRISGKVYIVAAILVSVSGIIFTWFRGSAGDTFMAITNTLQGFYILIFAIITIRFAINRKIVKHEIWAFRLFMVTSGVWFFRVFLMAWLLINGGPKGFDGTSFTGPFLTFLSFFTYAFPISLLILEYYRFAKESGKISFLITSSIVVIAAIAIITLGIFGALMGMWLPNM
jgi:hypothetical protein